VQFWRVCPPLWDSRTWGCSLTAEPQSTAVVRKTSSNGQLVVQHWCAGRGGAWPGWGGGGGESSGGSGGRERWSWQAAVAPQPPPRAATMLGAAGLPSSPLCCAAACGVQGELGLLCSDPGSASSLPAPDHFYAIQVIQLSLQTGVQADNDVFISFCALKWKKRSAES
jgi:hypothetical protein